MAISPVQCRAARALLSWSQDDLEVHSRIAKKTIADLERGARYPHDRSNRALQETLEEFGVVFIPQNGGGEGVRLKTATPRLFRRDDVPQRKWVAFAFDYREKRQVGFISYEALDSIALENLSPMEVFERNRQRILLRAAEKTDRSDFDPEGRVLIHAGELKLLVSKS